MGNPMRRDRATTMHPSHVDSFRRAREAGVRIAMGSDSGAYGHHVGLELELMVEAGMTPGEAIMTGTLRSAECLGWSAELGTVERGKRADLLVLNGDPTTDIGVIRRPDGLHMVLRGGAVLG
jgi:imidazolonepropionase-like amidohydrolase